MFIHFSPVKHIAMFGCPPLTKPFFSEPEVSVDDDPVQATLGVFSNRKI